VLAAGLGCGRGAEREPAEPVQRFGLAELVAEVAEQNQGLLLAVGSRRVVPGLLLDNAQRVPASAGFPRAAAAAAQRM